MRLLSSLLLIVCLMTALPATTADVAAEEPQRLYGETIYVPAYSRVFSYPNRSELLAATLAFHNIDPDTPLMLTRVDYHNEDGELLKQLLEQPVKLAPLQSRTVLIPINDTSGGVGANFIIEWSSDAGVVSPIAESIMTGPPGTPSPSFTSRGRAVRKLFQPR